MIIVEGTISAGKSTFPKMLQTKLPHHTMVMEPVEEWNKVQHGNSLLSMFYENPTRWAYSMELMTLMNRVKEYEYYRQRFGAQIIVERSIFSGRYCFAHNSYASGYLSSLEWQLYKQ